MSKLIMRDSVLAAIKLRGKGNPIFSIELENQFHITGAEIRDIVREARRNGIPICNDNGYYLARNYEEFKATIKDLEGRAISLLTTIKKFKIHFGVETENQPGLF